MTTTLLGTWGRTTEDEASLGDAGSPAERAALALEGSERRCVEGGRGSLSLHFNDLLAKMELISVTLDREGRVTYCNDYLLQLTDWRREEVLGRDWFELFVPPEIVRGLRGIHAATLAGRPQFRQHENEILTRSGAKRLIHWNNSDLRSAGEPIGTVSIGEDVTERRRAEMELEFTNAILGTQQETTPEAILVVDENAMISSYNRQFVDLWKVPEELLRSGKDDPVLHWALTQIEDQEPFLAKVKYLNAHKGVKSHDELLTKDGRTIERYSAPMVAKDGQYLGRIWYFRDVTERKATEQRIRALNVLYLTLSGINHVIVHSTSRRELCRGICDVVMKAGMWTGVWVGFVDDATRRVVPEVWSDSMAPYIERMVVSVDPDLPEGKGPTGASTRTGVPYFCNDIFADPATLPWRQFAKNFGINTVAAVPLRLGNAFVGVVNLYSEQKAIYTPEVQALLVELGDDVSFALQGLKTEALHLAAQSTLVESEAKFRGVVEQNISGIYIIQDEKFVYVNPWCAEIFGYKPEDLIGRPIEELVAEPDRPLVAENIGKRLCGAAQSTKYTFTGRHKDGSLVDIDVHGTVAAYGGKPAVIGLLQDVTERRKAEEQAKQYVAKLERAMLGTIDAVTKMLDLRDPYTSGHQRRVGELAAAIGAEMGLSEAETKGLHVIGCIHDIGKISVPAEILSKPSKLMKAEFEIMKFHPQQGYDILKSVEFPWPVAETVLQHHERLDGSGYPQGLKGEAILVSARIVAVADTIEAMATHRPYRPALGIELALKEIEEQSGKLYDANVVAACLHLFRDKGYVMSI